MLKIYSKTCRRFFLRRKNCSSITYQLNLAPLFCHSPDEHEMSKFQFLLTFQSVCACLPFEFHGNLRKSTRRFSDSYKRPIKNRARAPKFNRHQKTSCCLAAKPPKAAGSEILERRLHDLEKEYETRKKCRRI